jgi:hypothetical protein
VLHIPPYFSRSGIHGCFVLSAELVALRDGTLSWRNVTGRTQDIDGVVWSTPRVADDSIAKELQDAGIDIWLVGNCMAFLGACALFRFFMRLCSNLVGLAHFFSRCRGGLHGLLHVLSL